MLKRIIILLLAVIIIIPVPVFSQQTNDEKKTFEKLAKDLAELHWLLIQLQQQLEKMTPEERKQWCKDLQEKTEKNPPPFPIQFDCEK